MEKDTASLKPSISVRFFHNSILIFL